jgi:hypothetical protein
MQRIQGLIKSLDNSNFNSMEEVLKGTHITLRELSINAQRQCTIKQVSLINNKD